MKPRALFYPSFLLAEDRVAMAPDEKKTGHADGLCVSLKQLRTLTQLLIAYKFFQHPGEYITW